MRRILYSITITLLSAATLQAQEQPGVVQLSLQDAMNFAVKNNVNVQNARLDYKRQEAQNAEITGIALPQINGKGEFMDYINQVQSFVPAEFVGGPAGTFIAVPFTPKYSSTASISGSQILFDGSVLVALQARKAILKLTEQNVQLTEEQIRYNVQNAYYSFVIAQRQFQILSSSLAYIRSMAHDLSVMHENGFVEKIEIDRTNVQVNNLATDSLRIANILTLSEQALKYVMGMNINQPIQLTDTSVNVTIGEAQQLLLQDANYNNRTEFSLLNSQLELNNYDLKRYRFQNLPSLVAIGNMAYTYSTNTFSDLFKEQYIFYSLVGLQLNVPIFDGMQRRNRVKQARYNIQKTENNIQNLKLTIDFQEAQSKASLKNSMLALQSQERNLALAQSVLDLAQKKYKAGVGSNLEVSQAQTELLQAQNNYFSAMQDVITAKSNLQQALGLFKQ